MQQAGRTRSSTAEYEPQPLPPETIRALQVFKAHFAELISFTQVDGRHARGEQVLWVCDSQETLYNRCLQIGLKEEEFIVLCLLPDATEFIT